jgi:hypothetical protein
MNRTNKSLPRTPTLAAGPGGVHVSGACQQNHPSVPSGVKMRAMPLSMSRTRLPSGSRAALSARYSSLA